MLAEEILCTDGNHHGFMSKTIVTVTVLEKLGHTTNVSTY